MCALVAWTPRSGRIGPRGPFYISAYEHSWNALAGQCSLEGLPDVPFSKVPY